MYHSVVEMDQSLSVFILTILSIIKFYLNCDIINLITIKSIRILNKSFQFGTMF
jgi:hypothetical protein